MLKFVAKNKVFLQKLEVVLSSFVCMPSIKDEKIHEP
jgi:hypothetical protein